MSPGQVHYSRDTRDSSDASRPRHVTLIGLSGLCRNHAAFLSCQIRGGQEGKVGCPITIACTTSSLLDTEPV